MNNIPADALGNYGGTADMPKAPSASPISTGPRVSTEPRKTMSFNDMYQQSLNRAQVAKVESVPLSSLSLGSRYKSSVPYEDTEEMYAQQQSAGSKWLNAGLKTAGTFTSSFIGGTAGLVWGVGEAIATQRLAALADNFINRKVDGITTSMEDALPNYYTHKELDADAISTDNLLTANFWANKGLQNLGFAAGAIVGGGLWGKVLKSIGLLNGAVLAGRGMETATAVEKAMAAVPNVERYTAFDGALTSIARKYAINPIAQGLKQSERATISTLAAWGEGSIESIQKMKQFKENLVNEFILENGRNPQGDELERINEYTDNVGKYVLAGNLILLSLTNYIQLPKILGSSRRFDKALINQVEQKEIAGAWSSVAGSGLERFAKRAYNAGGLVFSGSEAFEEGGQYAIQEGVGSFFNKAYRNKNDANDTISKTYGAMNSVLGEGWDKVLTDKEGIESLLLGGISGGMMESGVIGTYRNEEGKTRIGIGKSGKIGERGFFGEGGERAANTNIALQALGKSKISDQLKTQAKYLAIGIGAQQERQEAIVNNDVFKEKDSEHDYVMSYVMPRVLYGKEESIYQELNHYAAQAATQEGFDELVTNGIVSPNEQQPDFIKRINNLRNITKSVVDVYDKIRDRYEDVRNEKGARVYSDDVLEKMVYATAKIDNYDQRIPQVNSKLQEAGISTIDVLTDIIEKGKTNKKATKDALDSINKIDAISDVKDELKSSLADVMRMSLYRKQFIDEYNKIKNNPEKYQDPEEGTEEYDNKVTVRQALPPEQQAPRKRTVAKELEVGKEYSLMEPIRREGNTLKFGPKLTVLSKTLGGEFEVKLPDGRTTFLSPQQFKDYKISDVDNSSEELVTLLDKTIAKVVEQPKYKEVLDKIRDTTFTAEGPTKSLLDHVNEENNPELIDEIEAKFAPVVEQYMKEQEEAREKREILRALQDELSKVQEEATKNSSTPTASSSVASEVKHSVDEGNKKDAASIFITTSTKSIEEDKGRETPYIVRYNNFMNNARNFKNRSKLQVIMFTIDTAASLGLDGVIPYMWGKDLTEGREAAMKNPASGNVVLAFVEVAKNGDKFFVDSEGKRLTKVGEPADFNKIIIADMPTASLEVGKDSKTGQPFTRNRENQKAEAEAYMNSWKKFRETRLFDNPELKTKGITPSFEFVISKGKPIINEESPSKNTVGGTLLSDDILENNQVLIVNTTGTVTGADGINYDLPVGRPYVKFDDLLQIVNNNQLSDNQAKTVLNIFKELINTTLAQYRGEKVTYDEKKNIFLRNILFFSNQEDVTSENKVYLKGTDLHIGDSVYDLASLDKYDQQILEKLKTVYHTVNNKTLAKGINEPFVEYYTEGDEVKSREWKSYQSYLLSGKTPDGKTREVPVTTSVEKQTPAVPYNYTRKYTKLLGLELPIEKPKKEPAATTTPQPAEGGFDQSFPTKFGDIKYKYKLNEKGNAEIDIDPNSEAVKAIAKNGELVQKFIEMLKKTNLYSSGFSAEEVVISLYTGVIGDDIKKRLAEEAAPKATETDPRLSRPYENKKQELADIKEISSYGKTYSEALDNLISKTDTLNNELNKRQKEDTKDRTVKQYTQEELEAQPEYQEIKRLNNLIDKINNVYGAAYGFDATTLEGVKEVEQELEDLPNKRKTADAKKLAELEETPVETTPSVNKEEIKSAVEEAKTEEPTLPSVGQKEDDVFSLASEGETMNQKDIDTFRRWAKDKLPMMPYQYLDNMLRTPEGRAAFGKVSKGVAYIVKTGKKGTEYHESFHYVFNYLLPQDQQDAIIAEGKARPGSFVDRASGKTINYAEATDRQIEEKLADEFADFRLGKLSAKSLSERILEFFRGILDFFKSIIGKGKEDTIQRLFENIDKGKFARKQLLDINKRLSTRFSLSLSERQMNARVEDLTARVFRAIMPNNRSLFQFEKVNIQSVLNTIREENPGYKAMPDVAWKELLVRTKDFMSGLRINFDGDSFVNINDENANRNEYAANAFTVDYKKSSPVAVKLFVSSIVKTKKHEYGLFSRPTLEKAPEDLGGGFQLIPYNQAFSTLLNHFQNVKDQDTFVRKLVELAKEKSEYTTLFLRLKGDLTSGKIDFDAYDDYDWRLFTQFFLTFTKQRPEAIKQFNRGNQVSVGSAVQVGSVKDIKGTWYNDMLVSAVNLDIWQANVDYVPKENEPPQLIKKTGNFYTVNKQGLEKYDIKNPYGEYGQLAFLSNLGINFGDYAYERVSDKEAFARSVNKIRLGLLKLNTRVNKIKGKQLDIDTGLDALAGLYAKATSTATSTTLINVNGEQIQEFTDSNAPSYFESVFNSVETLDELLNEMPHLNDVFSASSEILKQGGLFFDTLGKRTDLPLRVQYINGIEDLTKGNGRDTAALDQGDRLTVEINQNIDGNYYILIPADSSTEWMMRVGNRISYDRFADGETGIKDSLPIFHNYLFDEINLAKDAKRRAKANNISEKMAKELRFFKGILSQDMLDKVNDLINTDGFDRKMFDDFLNKKYSTNEKDETLNVDVINRDLTKYLNGVRDELKDLLIQNNQVTLTKQGKYDYPGLIDKFLTDNKLNKKRLTEEQLNNILSFVNTNYILNNIEFHKILFGDPYQFKTENGLSEATKRAKSFLSQRRRSFNSVEYTNFLNREMNKVDGIQLTPNDPGYHEFKPYLRTVTSQDVYTTSDLANSDKPYASAYARNNETDASSRLSPTAWREIKKRNGQWSDEAEAFHQWQMAWTRQNWPNYKYTNRELEAHDIELIKKPCPIYMIDVLKPSVSGAKYGKDFIDNVIDKFSQLPVYYSMVKGKVSEEHYMRMFEDKIDYDVVLSGRKMGAEGLRDLYNPDGTYNNSKIEKADTIEIPWEAYGIQQENSYEKEKFVTRGSQLNKLATVDLYSNGEPIGATPERKEVIRKAVDRNTLALSNLVDQGYRNLLNKLGIEDLGGEYKLVDKSAVAEMLRQSMLSQQMSLNAIDSVTLVDGEFKIPFEASTNYIQIKNLLYSIVNKSIVSPKMNGFAGVQVPSTMMEEALVGRILMEKYEVEVNGEKKFKYREISRETYEALSDQEKKNVSFGAKDLKFYEDEDGKRYCEIYLPNYLYKYFPGKTEAEVMDYLNNSPDGQKILSGIGFRIPTQALSSVEVFRVKGFLPSYMGRSVIVPSEITTKAGSDFDIDKLNMYLRSVFKDADGDIRLVQLRGTAEQSVEEREQLTKNYFRKIFDDIIEQEIVRLSKYDNFRDKLVSFFSKLEAIQQLEGQVDLNALSEDDQRFYAVHENILNNIMDQATENGVMPSDYMRAQIETIGDVKSELFAKILASKTRSQYVESMYGKALENEFYDSLEELLTLPENFDRLVNPNTDKSLKDLAKDIDKLEGVDESSVVNPLLNRSYMSALRHAFTLAKKWVGVAAVNITGNSLYQKTQVYVKDSATSLLFKHNTVEINGQKHISLSSMLNTMNQYISDKLSEYANGFVDVAKDPYILKLIYSDRIVGSFMFLERAGVATDTIAYFMNQPIIKQHVKYLDTTKKSINSINNRDNINYTQRSFKTSPANLKKAELLLAEYKESGDIEKLNKLLRDNIENGKNLDSMQNAIQHLLLKEFLKVVKLASANFKVSQAVNYDTTNFRSSEEFDRKNELRESAIDQNLIGGIEGILESSFISPIIDALEKSTSALGEILIFNKDQFREVLKNTLKYYSNNEYISAYKFRKIAEKATASFLDYLIFTKGPYIDMKGLLVDEGSVGDRVLKYKESRKDIQILQRLSVVFRENAENNVKTVKLNSKLNNAADENMLTGYMREMRNDSDPAVRELYNDLVRVIITQGSVMSPGSLKRIVPLEDYAKIIAPIMKNLVYDEDIANFVKGNWFQKNMYYDRDVAVMYTPSFDAGIRVTDPESGELIVRPVPKSDPYDIVEPEVYPLGGDNEVEISQYYMSSVVENKNLGATYDNKKLLRISESARGAGSPIIVIPRIIPAPYGIKESIDFESASTVPNKRYAILEAEIGDAVNMVYGYELVTDDVTGKPVTDQDSNGNVFYFYKATNLFGDPGLAVEYGLTKAKSSFENNTKIIDNPLSNREIANEYSKFKKETAGEEDRDYDTDALSEDLKCK